MSGNARIHALTTRLESVFDRALAMESGSQEQADYARFLCVLVCGHVEQVLRHILLQHARERSPATLQRYIEKCVSGLTNVNSSKLIEFFGKLDPDWRRQMEIIVVDDKKEALDSVLGLRNQIAHGGQVGVSYRSIRDYYDSIDNVLERARVMVLGH